MKMVKKCYFYCNICKMFAVVSPVSMIYFVHLCKRKTSHNSPRHKLTTKMGLYP